MDAAVHLGPIGLEGRALVRQFYQKCGFEIVGPGRITTGDLLTFETLEGLLDRIAVRTETYQVIVCHGRPDDGLLVPFTPESPAAYRSTGALIRRLGEAARRVQLGAVEDSAEVIDLASYMGVSADVARRLIGKLARVPGKILEFRGCNIGANRDLLVDYRKALHALSASAPNCRMFYVPVRPHQPAKPATMTNLTGPPKGGRRRLFEPGSDAKLAAAGPLILDVIDIDGHTNVQTEAFMDAPNNAATWARAINGAWPPGDAAFVTQVLWNNAEASYDVPLDETYRRRLIRV